MTLDSSNEMLDLPDSEWYRLSLMCSHTVYTRVKLLQQYEQDDHYVFCPPCRQNKESDIYARPPSAWTRVLRVEGVSNDEVRDVRQWAAFLLSRDILRLQPNVPANRIRPFPYVKGIR